MTMTVTGWGGSGWGSSPWGSGFATELRIVDAVAVRENVVRVTFNVAPRFTGTLEPGDGSAARHYQVIALDTFDADGQPAVPVGVLGAAVAPVAGSAGRAIDVTLDRPMSAYPTRYRVAVTGLVADAGGALLAPGGSAHEFDAVRRGEARPLVDQAATARDIANPQTLSAFFDPLPEVKDLLLGSIPVDEQGDYAFDQGVTSFRKRVFRRLMTRKGKFAHLPGYGVGTPDQVKRLARPGVADEIAADAEVQIAQEPETQTVSARFEHRGGGAHVLRVRVRTHAGETVNLDLPFNPTEF